MYHYLLIFAHFITPTYQTSLDRFWGESPSSSSEVTGKRRKANDGGGVRTPEVGPSKTSPSVNTGEAQISGYNPKPRNVPLDISVSCQSTDTTLPRLAEPEVPFLWAVRWAHSDRLGLMFEKTKVFDFHKTSFFNCRMLVS